MMMTIVLLIFRILEATPAFGDSSCWDQITVTFAAFFIFLFVHLFHGFHTSLNSSVANVLSATRQKLKMF